MHMKKLLFIIGAAFFALAGCVQVSPENSEQDENTAEELPINVIDNTENQSSSNETLISTKLLAGQNDCESFESEWNSQFQEILKSKFTDLETADKFISKINTTASENSMTVFLNFCALGGGDTLVSMKDDRSGNIGVMKWLAASDSLVTSFNKISPDMDMPHKIYLNLLPGKYILASLYGDAGVSTWRAYSLESDTLEEELVEKCVRKQTFNDGSFINEFELECEQELKL